VCQGPRPRIDSSCKGSLDLDMYDVKFQDLPVGIDRWVLVYHDVDVRRATLVVPRIKGGELDETLIVCELTTTQEGVFMDSSRRLVASVVACRISAPQLDKCVGERLAGSGVDNPDIKNKRHTTVNLNVDI